MTKINGLSHSIFKLIYRLTMTPQQLQQLKKAIHTACPELKELTFGCEVWYGDEAHEPQKVIIGNPYEYINGKITNPWNKDDTSDLFDIIGHPIQLHHVLRAIRKNIKSGWYYSVDEHGYISKTFDFVEVHPLEVQWNLTKPFDEQEPEVHKFLYKLIVGEEK